MEAIIGAVGNLLTPSKQSEPVEMPVTNDAINGDAERVIETQVSSICSADSNLDMSAHDTAKHTPVENNPTGRKKIQKNAKSTLKNDASDGVAQNDDCGMCKKPISKSKVADCAECGFCEGIFCQKCTEITPHMCKTVLNRADVLWACYSCLPKLENAKLATPLDQESTRSSDVIVEGKVVMQKFDSLRDEIDGLKGQMKEAVVGISKFSQDISKQMREIMNDTIFGDDYPEFDPNISHKQAKRIANEQNKTPPPTLNTIMKSAVNEQKREEKKEDSEQAQARCNIIIYNLEEPSETDGERRKTSTNDKISELLNFLEVTDITPLKTHRLGKFQSGGSENNKSRPLKVILKNVDEAKTIVNSCKKLKNAPANLKMLSVSHDLTNEERKTIREEVKKAKEMTAKSPNLDFKVMGPPWQPRIQSFKRRVQGAGFQG